MVGLTKTQADARINAYLESSSDRSAAEIVGMGVKAFAAWRRNCGLPPKTCTKQTREIRMTLWQNGWFDAEIALFEGCGETTIRRWRHQNQLQANGRTKNTLPAATMLNAIDSTMTDQEAAALLGLTKHQVFLWRRKNGISARHNQDTLRFGRSKRDLRRWEAYVLATSSGEMAKLLDLPHSAVTRWMRTKNLPPHRFGAFKRLVCSAADSGDHIAFRGARVHGWR